MYNYTLARVKSYTCTIYNNGNIKENRDAVYNSNRLSLFFLCLIVSYMYAHDVIAKEYIYG